MYKQNTYKLQTTMKTNSTSKHNNKTYTLKKEKQRKKQLSEKPKRSWMFQQLHDFNNNKWYRSISKGSSNSKE
jgi:hypothetical protein